MFWKIPKRQRPITIARSRAAPSAILPPEDENTEMLNFQIQKRTLAETNEYIDEELRKKIYI